MNSSGARILVFGYIVRGPLGGLAWHHLQYFLGLVRLGNDVWFLEDSDDYPSCYDPTTWEVNTDPSYGLEFTRELFDRVGFSDRWAYYDKHTDRWLGPARVKAPQLISDADILLNISGVNPLRDEYTKVPVRALIDTDPVFTQIRNLTDPAAMEAARRHTAFFTFGENFGQLSCTIPDDSISWQPTRQPVVVDVWPVSDGPRDGKFTTVMQWDSYPERSFDGRRFGMKSTSFAEYLDLPKKVGNRFELALGSESAPRTSLEERGWILSDPLRVTKTPWTYQNFIQRSKAEFTVAKHGYVDTNSGWFSERSAGYLASGRPVITQETGFSSFLPTGEGLFSFTSFDEAASAVESVELQYESHCRAARELAIEHFAASGVLRSLVDRLC